jgi:ABC-2 type transport system permease protein
MLFSVRISVNFLRQAVQTFLVGLAIISILRLPLLGLNAYSFVIIFITVLGVGGVSLMLGGLAMVYKNVSSIVSVLSLLALFFTGAIISIDRVGNFFIALKFLMPTTWGIEALRQSIQYGFVDESVIMGLFLQTVLFISIGIISFRWGFKRAQRQGSLGTY